MAAIDDELRDELIRVALAAGLGMPMRRPLLFVDLENLERGFQSYDRPRDQLRSDVVQLCTLAAAGDQRPLEVWCRNAAEIESSRPELKAVIERISGVLAGSACAQPGPVDHRIDDTGLLRAKPWCFVERPRISHALTKYWHDPDVRVVSVLGLGGSGKSSIVAGWLKALRKRDFDGARCVFAWRFEAADTSMRQTDAAEAFIDDLSRQLGLDTRAAPRDKARALARAIRQRHTLLVLDGLEVLQSSSGHIKDDALQHMLRDLSGSMSGLCVLTSRVRVRGVSDPQEIRADRLELSEAVELLRKHRVREPQGILERLAERYRFHPLSLHLAGHYLSELADSTVSELLLKEPAIEGEDPEKGIERLVTSYARKMGPISREMLRAIALFGERCSRRMLDALLEPPPIEGLLAGLASIDDRERAIVLKQLRDLRLIDPRESEPRVVVEWIDMHPLIRACFGRRPDVSEGIALSGWRVAHGRLFEYFRQRAAFERRRFRYDIVRRAVRHGCAAERHPEAWALYDGSLKPDPEEPTGDPRLTSAEQQALFTSLATLAHFFEGTWKAASKHLTGRPRPEAMLAAGFRLFVLGYIADAWAPLGAAVDAFEAIGVSERAAYCAGTLSSLCLLRGAVDSSSADGARGAVEWAQRAVEIADRSDDLRAQVSKRVILGDALHHAGLIELSLDAFEGAEVLQAKLAQEHPFLSSVMNARFCDLLLAMEQVDAVRKRTKRSIDRSQRPGFRWTLALALDHLILARCALLEPTVKGLTAAEEALTQARRHLEDCGRINHQPRLWLLEAELDRRRGDFQKAREALARVEDAVNERGLRLYEPPLYLERACLALAQDQIDDAVSSLAACQTVIDETGLDRYKPQLAVLRTRLESSSR